MTKGKISRPGWIRFVGKEDLAWARIMYARQQRLNRNLISRLGYREGCGGFPRGEAPGSGDDARPSLACAAKREGTRAISKGTFLKKIKSHPILTMSSEFCAL